MNNTVAFIDIQLSTRLIQINFFGVSLDKNLESSINRTVNSNSFRTE
jgi:hypothetical protein